MYIFSSELDLSNNLPHKLNLHWVYSSVHPLLHGPNRYSNSVEGDAASISERTIDALQSSEYQLPSTERGAFGKESKIVETANQGIVALTVNTPAVLPVAQEKAPAMKSHGPLLLVSVNPILKVSLSFITQPHSTSTTRQNNIPSATLLAVYVAQVPVVYHVPALIKHPLFAPPVYACKNPFPTYGVPVGVDPGAVLVVGEAGKYFGTYRIPVSGQSLLLPSGDVGMKVPVGTLPRTL